MGGVAMRLRADTARMMIRRESCQNPVNPGFGGHEGSATMLMTLVRLADSETQPRVLSDK